jgi:hypothetical protein
MIGGGEISGSCVIIIFVFYIHYFQHRNTGYTEGIAFSGKKTSPGRNSGETIMAPKGQA